MEDAFKKLQRLSRIQNNFIKSLGVRYVKGSTYTNTKRVVSSKLYSSNYTEIEIKRLLELKILLKEANMNYIVLKSKTKKEKVK